MAEPVSPRGRLKTWFPTLPRVVLMLLIMACGLAMLMVLTAAIYDIWSSARLRDARQAAADANVPLTMKAVQARRGMLKDTENAAPYYEAAFSLHQAEGHDALYAVLLSWQDDVSITPDEALPEEFLADVRAIVEMDSQTLDILHRGALREKCVYNVHWDGANTLLPHLTMARSCGRLLKLAAILAAEENRPAEGIETVRDAVALSRSLADEPVLVSAIVSFAISSISTSEGLARLVSRTDVSPEDLIGLQEDLERFADELSMRAALEGEIARTCDFCNSILSGEGILAHMSIQQDPYPSSPKVTAFDRIPVFLKKGYVKADMAFTIRVYLDYFKQIDSGVLMSEAEKNALRRRINATPYILTRMLLPMISRASEHAELTRSRLRATATALAALRFELDNGRWPEDLGELVPAYTRQVPQDPFSGKPLVYTVLDDGIMIYSVGRNRTDDGGRPRLVKRDDGKPGDYDDYSGFRIWKALPQATPGDADEAE